MIQTVLHWKVWHAFDKKSTKSEWNRNLCSRKGWTSIQMQQKYRAGAGTELGAPAILVRSSSTDLLSLISTAHIALTSTLNS